jgi:hypothetical protein
MQPVIAAGLCLDCSEMSSDKWHRLQPNTNHVEQLHQASYQASGRYVSILEAIKA